MRENIKNSAVDLTDLALGIIVLGIVVSIGANLLINFRDARLTDLSTATTTNESTFINMTGDKLAHVWGKSVDACWADWNQTQDTTNNPSGYNISIPSTNWTATINSGNGYITLQNSTATNYTNASCTYTWYNTSRADWAVADDATTGLAEYGSWFKIIVIVGVAALVLSLIFLAFGNKGQVGGQSY